MSRDSPPLIFGIKYSGQIRKWFEIRVYEVIDTHKFIITFISISTILQCCSVIFQNYNVCNNKNHENKSFKLQKMEILPEPCFLIDQSI